MAVTLADEIMGYITRRKRMAAAVIPASNLYTDLGYDSLAFVALLVELEGRYGIEFQLEEMAGCLHAGRLVALTQQKVKEAGCHPTSAAKRQPPGPCPD